MLRGVILQLQQVLPDPTFILKCARDLVKENLVSTHMIAIPTAYTQWEHLHVQIGPGPLLQVPD